MPTEKQNDNWWVDNVKQYLKQFLLRSVVSVHNKYYFLGNYKQENLHEQMRHIFFILKASLQMHQFISMSWPSGDFTAHSSRRQCIPSHTCAQFMLLSESEKGFLFTSKYLSPIQSGLTFKPSFVLLNHLWQIIHIACKENKIHEAKWNTNLEMQQNETQIYLSCQQKIPLLISLPVCLQILSTHFCQPSSYAF